jgi:hypothetical protein
LKEKIRTGKLRDNDHAQCNVVIQSMQLETNKLIQQLNAPSSQSTKSTRLLEQEIERLNRQVKENSLDKSADFRAMEN